MSSRRQAKRRFPGAAWIIGDGHYAVLAHCNTLTVTLYATVEEAGTAKRAIDDTACGARCQRDHQIVKLP